MKVKQKSHIVDVEDCPRCGQEHESLLFSPLTNPDGEKDYFAFCTEKTEPVMASGKKLGTTD